VIAVRGGAGVGVTSRGRRGPVERGASAVEFALILPLLLLVIAGVVDFGRALFTQVILTNAAREGARAAIFTSATPGPQVRATKAAPGVSPLTIAVQPCSANPGPSDYATVVARNPNFQWILLRPAMNLFGGGDMLPTTLAGKAVMKCGG
jgi:Flp pilus assembly pilin Flp